ncbi:hypothetical protein WAJ21_20310, partial [Acinetobacter baumannii]
EKVTSVVLDSFELNYLVLKAIAAELGIDTTDPDTLSFFYGKNKFAEVLKEYEVAAVCVQFVERKKSIHRPPRKP